MTTFISSNFSLTAEVFEVRFNDITLTILLFCHLTRTPNSTNTKAKDLNDMIPLLPFMQALITTNCSWTIPEIDYTTSRVAST